MGVLKTLGQWMNNRQAKKTAAADQMREAQQQVQQLFDMHARNQDIDIVRSMMRSHRFLEMHQAFLSAVGNHDETMVKLLLPKTPLLTKRMGFLQAVELNNLVLVNLMANTSDFPLRSYVEAILIAGFKQHHDLACVISPMHQGLQRAGWTSERLLKAISSSRSIGQEFEQSSQWWEAPNVFGPLLTKAVLGQHHDILELMVPLATGNEKTSSLYCIPDNTHKLNKPAPLPRDTFRLFLNPPAHRSIHRYTNDHIDCLLEYSMHMDPSGTLIHDVLDAFPRHTFDFHRKHLGDHVAQWNDAVVRKLISSTDKRGVFGLCLQSIESQNDAMFFASIEHLQDDKDRQYFLVHSAQQGRTSYVQYLVNLGIVRDEDDMSLQWATHYRHQEIFDILYPHAHLQSCLAQMKKKAEEFNNPRLHQLGEQSHDYALLEATMEREAITQSLGPTPNAAPRRARKI